MWYLLSSLFLFIAAAFILGLVIGWITCKHEPRKDGLGWFWFGLSVFVFGLFISATKWIKGSPGLWFDSAMWLFGAYILGCLIGCMISQWLRPEPASKASLSATDKLTMLSSAAPVAAAAAVVAVAARPAPPAGPAAVRPYQWQAARDANAVTLTGYVPTDDVRGRVVAAARGALAPVAVVDKLQLGTGAPAGMETMTSAAFGHLSNLDKGIASLIDTKYTLTGVAGTQPNYDSVMSGVRALPMGYSLAKVDIVAPPAPKPAPKPVPVAVPAPKPVAVAAPAPKAAAPVAVVAAPVKPMPKAAPKIAGEDKVPGKRPPGYAKPIDGKADDLKRIRGIGQQNEGRLHGLGIWHFDQVARWNAQECLWVGSYLAFPGRIEREEWVKQAKTLAAGKDTEFSRRVKKGKVATSRDDGSLGKKNVEVVKPMRAVKGAAPKGTKKS
jgi:predicted flap endonuclease-1-like 5' DNA nuclease